MYTIVTCKTFVLPTNLTLCKMFWLPFHLVDTFFFFFFFHSCYEYADYFVIIFIIIIVICKFTGSQPGGLNKRPIKVKKIEIHRSNCPYFSLSDLLCSTTSSWENGMILRWHPRALGSSVIRETQPSARWSCSPVARP